MSSNPDSRTGLTFSLKLSLLYALFFAVASLALFLVAYGVITQLVDQREREIVQGRIQEYRAWYAEGGLRAIRSRFDAQANAAGDIFFTRITGPFNEVLFVSVPPGSRSFDPSQLDIPPVPARKNTWLSITDDGKNVWTVGATRLPGGLVLQVGKNATRSREFLAQFRSVFVRFVVPLLLLGIVTGGLLTFRAMQPIRRLVQTVRGILNTGDTRRRVPAGSGGGELNDLVELFNRMLDQNGRLIEAMHQSLDNVAHDLRTPMARLRAGAEMALGPDAEPGAVGEALADCMEESERVLTMLDTLMDVAEAQTGAMRLDIQDVSVPDIIRAVVDLYQVVAEEKGLILRVDLPDRLAIRADRVRVRQAVANLVDNAVKYSRSGGVVTLSAKAQGPSAVIAVADQGVGICSEERPRIWDRLYRGDRSRSERGLGLGLSLVQAIVQAHGGTVAVVSEPDKGSVFSVTFPAST